MLSPSENPNRQEWGFGDAYQSPDLKLFSDYEQLADSLIRKASKEQVAEAGRLLALNLAHYVGKYGALPLKETLALLGTSTVNEEQAKLLVTGMEQFVGVLGGLLQ